MDSKSMNNKIVGQMLDYLVLIISNFLENIIRSLSSTLKSLQISDKELKREELGWNDSHLMIL